ncbi:hypothetical protein GCM10010340_69720 [Streptomyces griseoloalbus]|nr:hypothetical protein GCM10010340_69720 [Streptomyces albaduncus]
MVTVIFPSYGSRHPPPCGEGGGKPRRACQPRADSIRSIPGYPVRDGPNVHGDVGPEIL